EIGFDPPRQFLSTVENGPSGRKTFPRIIGDGIRHRHETARMQKMGGRIPVEARAAESLLPHGLDRLSLKEIFWIAPVDANACGNLHGKFVMRRFDCQDRQTVAKKAQPLDLLRRQRSDAQIARKHFLSRTVGGQEPQGTMGVCYGGTILIERQMPDIVDHASALDSSARAT